MEKEVGVGRVVVGELTGDTLPLGEVAPDVGATGQAASGKK